MPNRQEFIKYGRWDTLEHAMNGLTGPNAKKIAEARYKGYKLHKKVQEILNGKIRD